jgi:hypothetical protein
MAIRLLKGQTINGTFYDAFTVIAGLGSSAEALLVQGGDAHYANVAVLAGEDADAIRLVITQLAAERVFPLWNGLAIPSVQFRGATDSAASLGTLGFIFNASNDAEAAVLLEASTVDEPSVINGASPAGAWYPIELPAACTTVHVGQMGMAAPLSLATSGTVDAATKEFMRWDFDPADNVRWLFIHEGPPTNYAGAPGTGSARMVSIYGVVGET